MERILAKALGEDLSTLAVEEKRLLLSRLLARFAHEVRNPLSSLDIHVQLLEEDLQASAPELREKAASRFEIIHGEIHRLENIVKQFLSLSGPSSLDLEPVEVARTIHHVCDLLGPEAAAKKIDLRAEVAETLPPVMADPAQLTQALLNLAINAIQAIGSEGWVEIAASQKADGRGVIVEVRDSGPGIAAENRVAIFEPFYSTKSEGSGLGLWIVQQIVTAHGGKIQIRDGQGGGAVFAVELPHGPEQLEP